MGTFRREFPLLSTRNAFASPEDFLFISKTRAAVLCQVSPLPLPAGKCVVAVGLDYSLEPPWGL